jgi:hypothetical protein
MARQLPEKRCAHTISDEQSTIHLTRNPAISTRGGQLGSNSSNDPIPHAGHDGRRNTGLQFTRGNFENSRGRVSSLRVAIFADQQASQDWGQRLIRMKVFLIRDHPVIGDILLRGGEVQLPVADHLV